MGTNGAEVSVTTKVRFTNHSRAVLKHPVGAVKFRSNGILASSKFFKFYKYSDLISRNIRTASDDPVSYCSSVFVKFPRTLQQYRNNWKFLFVTWDGGNETRTHFRNFRSILMSSYLPLDIKEKPIQIIPIREALIWRAIKWNFNWRRRNVYAEIL